MRKAPLGGTLEPDKASDLTPHPILGPSWTGVKEGRELLV